jgi:hypothetical protein
LLIIWNVEFQGSICCGYGTAGATTKGNDCVMIPGATSFAGKLQKGNSICGQKFVTATNAINKTICSKSFIVFHSTKMSVVVLEAKSILSAVVCSNGGC